MIVTLTVLFERWTTIYPAYINSKKTQSLGRKVPKSKVTSVECVIAEMRLVMDWKSHVIIIALVIHSQH